MQEKNYDLIVWGATGFTGRLVVEYLYTRYGIGKSLHWAIAGRNGAKLEKIRQQLGAPDLPVILADSSDKPSLEAMVRQTKVVCATVGPYALYGSPLVEACVENGTDYCDLTGEVQWIRRMIDAYHTAAANKKVRIVHCCGFDSIPSDFGVYFIQKEARARTGQYCQQVKMRVGKARGKISGGTYFSLANVLAEAEQDPSIYRFLQDPYNLNPPGERSGPDQQDLSKAVFDPDLQGWISPFIMASINTRIVRRSHALAAYPYGEDFHYDEAMWHGSGLWARISAHFNAFFFNWLTSTRSKSIIRKIANLFAPKPGEGPSEAERKAGFFSILFLGQLTDGRQLKAEVTSDEDPGYGSTSKMLAENAVCLATDRDKLPDSYGILTPSVAMGDALLQRLIQNAGLKFQLPISATQINRRNKK